MEVGWQPENTEAASFLQNTVLAAKSNDFPGTRPLHWLRGPAG